MALRNRFLLKTGRENQHCNCVSHRDTSIFSSQNTIYNFYFVPLVSVTSLSAVHSFLSPRGTDSECKCASKSVEVTNVSLLCNCNILELVSGFCDST